MQYTFAVLFVAFSTFSLTGCQKDDPDLLTVNSLRLEGTQQLSPREIRKKLVLREKGMNPFSKKSYFDGSVLESDKKRIIRIYEENGIYGTRVVSQNITENDGAVDIALTIKEGLPVTVKTVKLTNLPRELEWQPEIREGSIFKEDQYRKDEQTLATLLAENGYPFAKVTPSARVNLEAREVLVEYQIENATKKALGDIFVTGAVGTNPEQLKEHSGLKSGALYKNSDLRDAERALYDLNVFERVEISALATSGDRTSLEIRVDEKPFESLGLGAGLGVSRERDEVRFRLLYDHYNFLGGLRRLQFEARPAYIYVPSFWDPQGKGLGGQTQISFFQPDNFLRHGVHHVGSTVSLNFERDIQDGYKVDSGGTRVGLIWPINSPSTIDVGYNWTAFSLVDYPDEIEQCGGIVCVVSYLDQRFVFDRRDSRLSPRSGLFASLHLAEAGLGGHFSYFNLNPEGRAYLPVTPDLTLALRANYGEMRSRGVTPIPRRYYAGGSSSHRGFGYRRLSPYVRAQKRKRPVPVGGEFLAVSNIESRYQITEKLENIVFFDVGNVTFERSDLARQLNYATGLGFKYDTAIAPIRFDLGYRLNVTKLFRDEPRFVFHFTIGDAF